MTDPYLVLGIAPGASPDEIKKAYKRKAAETHPDKPGGSQEAFIKVQQAYENLTKKQPEPPPFNPMDFDFGGFSFDDFYNFSFSGFTKPAENRPPNSDSNVRVNIQTNIEEIKFGKTYKVKYKKSMDCGECEGKGGKASSVCGRCQGSGMIVEHSQQQGFRFVHNRACDNCVGRGRVFTDPCVKCDTKGYVIVEEKLSFKLEKIEEDNGTI